MTSKRPPMEVTSILKRCPADLLTLFSKIKDSPQDCDALLGFVREEIEICKDTVLKLPEKDPIRLAIDKSFERGRVQSLSLIVYLIEFSKEEINRRIEAEK